MQVHINDISTVSHMTYHDGKPCDLYTATVVCTLVGYGVGSRRRYLCVYARTEQALENKLKKYRTDDIIDITGENLYDRNGRLHGEA